MVNKKQQINKAPKFLAFLDTSSNEKFEPLEGMIKRETLCGLSPCYYVELNAKDAIDAIAEALPYKQEGVYLVDILQKQNVCDEFGYVTYKHVLRSRSSDGFHNIADERKSDWLCEYNPDYKSFN